MKSVDGIPTGSRMQNVSLRNEVYTYMRRKYKTEPEFLWTKFPDYAVFRHRDNAKWYAIIMDIPHCKLEPDGTDTVDVINLKMDSPLLVDLLTEQRGYFRGYHLNKGNWISALLDGTVDYASICDLIDKSYRTTASQEERKSLRPPKEWLIPSNPHYFDIVHAFDETEIIDWKQGAGIKKGDTVYMYVGVPVSAILYRCRVIETDIPYHYQEGRLTIRTLMHIRLERRYPPDRFPLQVLRDSYGVFSVRGPRGVPEDLSFALKKRVNSAFGKEKRRNGREGN